jgi:DNA ligase-1
MLVSRNFKPIPNIHIRKKFEVLTPDNVDGELILANGKPSGAEFNLTTSAVMTEEGNPHVNFHIFDYVKSDINVGYSKRMDDLRNIGIKDTNIIFVFPILISSQKELLKYEEECLMSGYEGVMIRSIDGPYKCGRSTEKEGYLLKLKRFEDSEAEIIGYEEKQSNQNEAGEDAFGHVKRSQKKEGMVSANTLGKIIVKDMKTGVEFGIGSGFDDDLRKKIWTDKNGYMGKIVKYKHQLSGQKEKPRFPVFLGFRHSGDMDGI